MRMVPRLRITVQEREELERRASDTTGSRRMMQRAQIVLLAADGMPNRRIAEAVGLNQNQVGMWRKRFAAVGMLGLNDLPRPGRPPRLRVV
jgi:transposase